MIRPRLFIAVLLLALTNSVSAQETSMVRCVITIYILGKNDGRPIRRVEFTPKIAEEELTNKTTQLPGSKLFIIASVFPTDESMASGKGSDSIRLGLAVTRKKWTQAFLVPNNALAEATFYDGTFDTARVETNTYAGRKRWVVRLECWDPRREKEE